jgi:hypothetical protein
MAESKKPLLRPMRLIIFEAKTVNTALPTIIIAVGRVERATIGVIRDPIIPLRNIVIGAAVKLKT